MRHWIIPFFFSLFLIAAASPPSASVITSATPVQPSEPISGAVVCQPGIYPQPPSDCLPLGPSAQLTSNAALGVPYPILPLPAYHPDSALNEIPFQYFRVNDLGTGLFTSLDDAISNQPSQTLAPGFLYVSYSGRVETENDVYYQLRSGAWIRGDGSRAGIPVFQGLQFSSTPLHSFGWVMGEVKSRLYPGFSAPETGTTWYRYNLVQVFAVEEAEGITWVMIGPNEWLDYRHVARVDPRAAPPDGVATGRWIEVNLDEQTLAVYDDNQLVFATVIASGVEPFWTQPGLFQIYEKLDTETMSGATTADRSDYYYLEDVPWTMYYDQKRALHGAYWHNSFGYPRSHGCVNLSLGDSHWLYDWASIGDYVYVYDPSGRTPTDPGIFGTGAP